MATAASGRPRPSARRAAEGALDRGFGQLVQPVQEGLGPARLAPGGEEHRGAGSVVGEEGLGAGVGPGRVLGGGDAGAECHGVVPEGEGGELAVVAGGELGGLGELGAGGLGEVQGLLGAADPVMCAGLGDDGSGEAGEATEVVEGGFRLVEAAQRDPAGEEGGVDGGAGAGGRGGDGGVGEVWLASPKQAAGEKVTLVPEGVAMLGRGGLLGGDAGAGPQGRGVVVLPGAAIPAGQLVDEGGVRADGFGQGGDESGGGGGVAAEGEAGFGGGAECGGEAVGLAQGGAVGGGWDGLGPGEAVEAAPLVVGRDLGGPAAEEGGFGRLVGDAGDPGAAGRAVGGDRGLGCAYGRRGVGGGLGAAEQSGDRLGRALAANVLDGAVVLVDEQGFLQAAGEQGLVGPIRMRAHEGGDLCRAGGARGEQAAVEHQQAGERVRFGGGQGVCLGPLPGLDRGQQGLGPGWGERQEQKQGQEGAHWG